MKRTGWLVTLVASGVTLGCAGTGSSTVDTAQATANRSGDEQAINAVSEREIAAFSAGAVDSLLALLAPDAVVMPPNEPIITGTSGVRTWAANMASQFTVNGRYTDSKISVLGDWAIERYTGALRITPKTGGSSTEENFKGLHVYHRQPDGRWLIVQDVWNFDAPPPAAPTPPPAK